MEEKRKRHFLYTWPTAAINKQAARPFANASQVHVRGRWALSEKLGAWARASAAEWGQVEQAERRTPVRRGNGGAASYATYSGERRSCPCRVPIKFWRSLKGNYICSLFNTPDHSHQPRALGPSEVHLDLHNASEKSRCFWTDYGSWFGPKMCSSSNSWLGWISHRKLTMPFESILRPAL